MLGISYLSIFLAAAAKLFQVCTNQWETNESHDQGRRMVQKGWLTDRSGLGDESTIFFLQLATATFSSLLLPSFFSAPFRIQWIVKRRMQEKIYSKPDSTGVKQAIEPIDRDISIQHRWPAQLQRERKMRGKKSLKINSIHKASRDGYQHNYQHVQRKAEPGIIDGPVSARTHDDQVRRFAVRRAESPRRHGA